MRRQRLICIGVLLAIVAVAIVTTAPSPVRGAAASPDQCIACHTDEAQLERLTPPDPPPTEAGEG
jgi:mono/diheme cytochrome c family protein